MKLPYTLNRNRVSGWLSIWVIDWLIDWLIDWVYMELRHTSFLLRRNRIMLKCTTTTSHCLSWWPWMLSGCKTINKPPRPSSISFLLDQCANWTGWAGSVQDWLVDWSIGGWFHSILTTKAILGHSVKSHHKILSKDRHEVKKLIILFCLILAMKNKILGIFIFLR